MGWSCTAKAGNRLKAIQNWCYWIGSDQNHRMENAWIDPKTGTTYFIEVGREQRDGAITGSIHCKIGETYERAGSFRIESDGRKFRGPAILKSISFYEVNIDHQLPETWFPLEHGTPNQGNLYGHVRGYAASFEKGGVNEHISRALGYVPYPTRAKIVNVVTGETVAEWKAAAFQVW